MKRRVNCFLLAMLMMFNLCAVAFAEGSPSDSELPPWVGEGETWYPANGIMPIEDFGNCPRNHTGPSGYTYQGYTTGVCTSNLDDFARVLTIISIISKDPITIQVAALGAVIAEWLEDIEDPNLRYFKYVYTNGPYTFYHIIYTLYHPEAGFYYSYISCETYYG